MQQASGQVAQTSGPEADEGRLCLCGFGAGRRAVGIGMQGACSGRVGSWRSLCEYASD